MEQLCSITKERKIIKNCPYCNSTKNDTGEYWHRYGDDRYLICHSCGLYFDNATEEELAIDQKLRAEAYNKRCAEEKEKRRVLYLKLKKEFE